MNAKMIITVEIESIPERVSSILEDVSKSLSDLSNEIYYSSLDIKNKNDLLKQIQTLDEVRKKLTTLDLNIEDCYTILKGYMNYHMKLEKESREIIDEPDNQER